LVRTGGLFVQELARKIHIAGAGDKGLDSWALARAGTIA
jgi:hypothetical protein